MPDAPRYQQPPPHYEKKPKQDAEPSDKTKLLGYHCEYEICMGSRKEEKFLLTAAKANSVNLSRSYRNERLNKLVPLSGSIREW